MRSRTTASLTITSSSASCWSFGRSGLALRVAAAPTIVHSRGSLDPTPGGAAPRLLSSRRLRVLSEAGRSSARPAAAALGLVGFVDHAEAVAVGVDEDDEVFVRSVLTLVAGGSEAEKPLDLRVLIRGVEV